MGNFNANFSAGIEDVGLYEQQDAVMAAVNQLGLQIPKPPMVFNQQTRQWEQYNGEIPPDLTQLSDDQLGELLGKLSVFIGYVEGQIALARMPMTSAGRELSFISANLRMQYKFDESGNKKRPEQERKDMVTIDKRYLQADARAVYHEYYYYILGAIGKAAEHNYAAVSRRISQRQGEAERDKRGSSVSNFQNPPVFRKPGL